MRLAWKKFFSANPPICESVKEWAAGHQGSRCETLFEPTHVSRALPRSVEDEMLDEYSVRQEADLRGKYLVPLERARLVGQNGLVILPDGSYAVESIYGRTLLGQDNDFRTLSQRSIVKREGSYFSLLCIWAKNGNYYHWLHDALLRLFKVIERLPEDVRYIVPTCLTPVQLESLRLLGIQDRQLEFFAGDQTWELEALYFCPPTSNSGSSRGDALAWLRDALLERCGVEGGPARRRLFLSRRLWHDRHIINEHDVERLLQRYGFETVMPERMSMSEQVRLFAEAKVVVSSHGAGLTNMVFAPEACVVVDMIQPVMIPWAYVFWTMSEALGHRYWYFLADAVSPRVAGRRDLFVPLDKLRQTLERVHEK